MRTPNACGFIHYAAAQKPTERVTALLVCHLRDAASAKWRRGIDHLKIGRPVMKAVLLAGGLGTRMREETEFRPKPMVEVGGRPVL